MPLKPIVFTEDQVKEVETLATVLDQTQLAQYFGITKQGLHKIMNRQEEVRVAYDRGRARAIASVGAKLLSKARSGNIAAMCFYLKTQAGWRETDRREITGADGGPIQTEGVSAREQIESKLAGLAAAIEAASDSERSDG